VWYWIDDVLTQKFTELNNLLGMARWAEPTATAGEGEQKLMATVRAADTSEAVGKVAALEITRLTVPRLKLAAFRSIFVKKRSAKILAFRLVRTINHVVVISKDRCLIPASSLKNLNSECQ
jgi:hypothetical protein